MNPWEQLICGITQLFSVKAIISLVVVFVFAFKALSGAEIGIEFYGVFMSVVVYWLCERTKKER